MLLARRRARWPLWAGWAGLLALFLVFLLTSGQVNTERYDLPETIRQVCAWPRRANAGRVLLQLRLACVQNRPLVQRVERDWSEVVVATLDIMKPAIRQFAYEARF